MAARTEDLDTDPFARAVPGQSFTDAPGKNAYEKPPMTASPEEALNVIQQSLEEPTAYKTIINLLDAGISSETIASSLVLKMFSEGVFSPDVAEIIKPPLVAHITDLGVEAGIQDINVVNEIPKDGMSSSESLEMMQQVSPEKYNRQMSQFMQEEEDMELSSQIDLPQEEVPMRESFLDMEAQ
jgi:hypothetical protein